MVQVFKKYKKASLLCFFIIVLLISCSNENLTNFILVKFIDEYGKTLSVEIHNEKTKIVKKFQLKGDVSYNNFNIKDKILFLYGPGGILKIDANAEIIEKISDTDTSHVFALNSNSEYGSVSNLGFSNETYISKINLGMEAHDPSFSVNYPVNSIEFLKNNIYISNLPIDDEVYFVDSYDLNGKLISRRYYDDFGRLSYLENQLVYLTQSYYILNDVKYDLPRPLFSIYDSVNLVNDKIDIFSYDYISMRCTNYSDEGDVIFEKCLGYNEVDINKYVVNAGEKIFLFDGNTKEKYILHSGVEGSYNYSIFPYQI